MKDVGVDVAKETHYACVTSQNNKVLTAPFAFKNTIDGYNQFLSKFKKFPKSDVVIGLESTGAQSTRMSKRGSPFLRYALVNSAWNVSMNNATFGEYYNLKLSQKGRHYKALGHVAGKLCRVIFAMMKNNMAFDLT
jgi:transposase